MSKADKVLVLERVIESLGLQAVRDSLVGTVEKRGISGGQRKRVNVGLEMVMEPSLLILDEPLTGLDAKSAKVLKELLELHVENGGSVIFSTHILEVAEDICDRICIINNGKEVATGTMDELSKLADKAGADLEEIFLKLTEQDASVNLIVSNLRDLTGNSSNR